MADPARPTPWYLVTAPWLWLAFLGSLPGAAWGAPIRRPDRLPAAPHVARLPAQSGATRFRTIHPVMLGIDVLESEGFAAVRGKRIGLLTNAAGVDRLGRSTIDVLRHAPGVRLEALFAPENGLTATEPSGQHFADYRDPRTGLPVHSLYGRTLQPTPAMLRGLDALVIDLQDNGVRSYTYDSTMKLALEACFEHGVEVVVLDRPNPLGGLKVGGPPMDADLRSFVGSFRVPYVYGLTIGELARMAALAPGVLAIPDAVRARGRLTIVPMRGWRRSMLWPDTGLKFVPTSPYIPDFAAVVGCATTGLGCEIGGFSHGLGRQFPFRCLTFPHKTPAELIRTFDGFRLPGLRYVTVSATGADNRPATGVYVEVSDWDAWQPTELSFYLMRLACRWNARNPFAAAPAAKFQLFQKLVGSRAWCNAIRQEGARINVEAFLAEWRRRDRIYQQESRRYWLYPE